MPGRQAKLLSDTIVRRVLKTLQRRPSHLRDRVIFLLSVRAGLRACEIAGLDWSMVLNANGRVNHLIDVRDRIAKKGGGRRIPIHPELKTALTAYGKTCNRSGPVITSQRSDRMLANSIVNWFIALYAEIGADGCPHLTERLPSLHG